MPLTLTYTEPSTFSVQASGAVTYAEVGALIDEVLADPHLCRGIRMLVDGNDVSAVPTTAELRAIARDMQPLLDRGLGPVAIVTRSTFVYGVARMFSTFAAMQHATVQSFREFDSARTWLEEEGGVRKEA